MANIVYIATSLDGFIADRNDGLDWLNMVPNPSHDDLGWADFMNGVDALIMGRVTFETVCSFDCEWPYSKPVFVLTSSLRSIPKGYEDKVELVNGSLSEVVAKVNAKGYENLYIDGGKTVQSFLKEDLVDELIITTIPILLGGGSPLFGDLPKEQRYELVKSEMLLNQLVKSHYKRVR